VLQFGFVRGAPRNVHDVGNHASHRIAYTGTHDNDTLRGWYASLPPERRARVDAARPGVSDEPWWDLIALTFSSRAQVAMVQAQDVLGLGSEARMNQPGRASGAWKWRLSRLPSADVGRRLRALSEAAGRDRRALDAAS
jgi:4-alpha-glucanotransferase